jgi:hypothetical protein
MIGEFLREVAVLTAVFIPLDRAMADKPLTTVGFVVMLSVSAGLLAGGIVIERKAG